jgi:alpha-tubulin suppressor-like RCC1 family protein
MLREKIASLLVVLILLPLPMVMTGCLGKEGAAFEQATTDNLQALSIDPTDVSVEVTRTRKFNGVGGYVGTTGYRYSLVGFGGNTPPGTIDPITGVFTAPATVSPGNAIAAVQVTDAIGNVATTTVIVISPMQITPTSQTVTVGKKANFDVIGGSAPITWSVVDATRGSITSTGLFTATFTAGTTTVKATDSSGNVAEAVVVVRDLPVLTPTGIRVPFGWTLQMVPFQGSPPFTYSLDAFGTSAGGTIDANGLLIAPSSTGTMVVTVKDYYDYTSTATLDVIQANNIVSGQDFNCVLLADTKGVKCWGDSSLNQTGYTSSFVSQVGGNSYLGDSSGELGPRVAVHYINNGTFLTSKVLSSGRKFTCVLDGADNVRCWGKNSYGEIGNSSGADVTDASNSTTGPKTVTFSDVGTVSATQLATGAYHTCVVDKTDQKKVYCWGLNSTAQLGDASVTNKLRPHSTSSALTFPTNVLDIKAGDGHTCVLLAAGAGTGNVKQIRCWGDNSRGQLGIGSLAAIGNFNDYLGDTAAEKTNLVATGTAYAVTLAAGKQPVQLAVGSSHTCTLLDDGSAYCWGDNQLGQLGRGVSIGTGFFNTPGATAIDLGAGQKILKLKAGYNKTCFILLGGILKCVGNNNAGSLGIGYDPNTYPYIGSSPAEMGLNLLSVAIGTGFYIIDVSIGQNHTCALMDDNRVKCWGAGNAGQLGNGSSTAVGTISTDMGDNLSAVGIF